MNFETINWIDYAVVDAGNGEKLEQVGPFRVRRPDSNAQQFLDSYPAHWQNPDAWYIPDGKNRALENAKLFSADLDR
jgi:hypothetical protein